MSEVNFAKLQEQYEFVGKMLGGLDKNLDDARDRLREIVEIRRTYAADTKLDEYHQRTVELLERAMDRYEELHDLMLQSGVDTLGKL